MDQVPSRRLGQTRSQREPPVSAQPIHSSPRSRRTTLRVTPTGEVVSRSFVLLGSFLGRDEQSLRTITRRPDQPDEHRNILNAWLGLASLLRGGCLRPASR